MMRQANREDLEEITAIYNYYIENSTSVYHYSSKSEEEMNVWYTQKEKEGFPVIVEELDGKIAGFATYGPYRPFEGYKKTIEHSVYVNKDCHGKGVGKKLLNAILQKGKESEYHVVVAYIDSENEISIRLHEKEGFVRCGTIKEAGYKFGKYRDLLIMEKFL